MRRSFNKSANVLVTLSVISGVVGTSTQALAGGATTTTSKPSGFKIPQYEVTVPHAVGSRIDQMDINLKAQFPQKLSASEREYALNVHAGGMMGGVFAAIFASRIGKETDSRLRKLGERAVELDDRAKIINSEIDRVQRNAEINTQKAQAIEEAVKNPKKAIADLSAKLNEEADELQGLIAQREQDIAALDKMAQSAPASAAKDIVPAINKRIADLNRDLSQMDAQYQTIFREAAEMKATGALPASVIGKDGAHIAQIMIAKTESEKQVAALRNELQSIESEFKAVTSSVKVSKSFLMRFADKTLRVVGVAGSLVIIANEASSYYVGYVLGQDPTKSPLVQFVMDAPQTEEYQRTAKFMQDAAVEISAQYKQVEKQVKKLTN